jgi:hypothetical protein
VSDAVRIRDGLGRGATLDPDDWDQIKELRPALADKLSAIERALADPSFVTEDREGARRQHFYRRSDLAPPYERGYVKITVDLRRRGQFWQIPVRIVDADIVSVKPAKEKLIWPPPTPGHLPM